MSNYSNAYSVHTAEELEKLRATQRESMLYQHAIERTAAQRSEVFTRLQNIATCCDELGEVAFALNSGEELSRKADLRGLLTRLRLVENELLAATDALADQLGLMAC
jgi:hypothetical protein